MHCQGFSNNVFYQPCSTFFYHRHSYTNELFLEIILRSVGPRNYQQNKTDVATLIAKYLPKFSSIMCKFVGEMCEFINEKIHELSASRRTKSFVLGLKIQKN